MIKTILDDIEENSREIDREAAGFEKLTKAHSASPATNLLGKLEYLGAASEYMKRLSHLYARGAFLTGLVVRLGLEEEQRKAR